MDILITYKSSHGTKTPYYQTINFNAYAKMTTV